MKILPRRIRFPKRRLIRVIIAMLIAICGAYFATQGKTLPQPSVNFAVNSYAVVQVYDGDTIQINMNGNKEKIRMIGVDTPETHDPRKAVQCFGEAASNFTTNLLIGKHVRLESDSLSSNRDRYDRLLRYVYVDETLVNAELIKQGYGFAYVGFPFTKMEDFKQYQKDAEQNHRGLWQDCTVQTKDTGQKQTNDN